MKRDNDVLQRKNDWLDSDNKRLDKELARCTAQILKNNNTITELEGKINNLKEDKERLLI